LHNLSPTHCIVTPWKQHDATRQPALQLMKQDQVSMAVRHFVLGHCWSLVPTTKSADATTQASGPSWHPFGSSDNHSQ